MKLTLIRHEEEFAAIQNQWEDLLAHSFRNNPFQSYQWLWTWWHVYGNGELYIITCRDSSSDELLGALPLYKCTSRGILSVSVLRFLGSAQGSADFLGCIARQGCENMVFNACLGYLFQNSGRWDLIELHDMDVDSPFYRFLLESAHPRMVAGRDWDKCCPYLSLPDSWDTLTHDVSKKVRQRIGYYRRALEKKGVVVLEEVKDSAELPDALSDMVRLRKDRMEQKGITTSAVTDAYCNFHGQLMTLLQKSGRLRLYFLSVDGKRVAYLYLFTGGDAIFYYQTGFDRSWGNQSVGFVLLGMVIESAIESGLKYFEFLRGAEEYKYEWGKVGERYLASVSIFGKSTRGYVCKLKHHVREMMVTLKNNVASRLRKKE